MSAIRVRCANPQPNLLTGTACGWTGRRKGRRVDTPRGTLQLKPTHERCPRCGSRVEEIPIERALRVVPDQEAEQA